MDSTAINIGSLTGGLVAALTGADVNVGASAGGNAVENNFLLTGAIILIATLEVIDKIIVANELIELAKITKSCSDGNTSACGPAKEMAVEMGIMAAVEGTVGNVIPGSAIAVKIMATLRKKVDPDRLKVIDDLIDKKDNTINTKSGNKGDWNDTLNNPAPNTTYKLENGHT